VRGDEGHVRLVAPECRRKSEMRPCPAQRDHAPGHMCRLWEQIIGGCVSEVQRKVMLRVLCDQRPDQRQRVMFRPGEPGDGRSAGVDGDA